LTPIQARQGGGESGGEKKKREFTGGKGQSVGHRWYGRNHPTFYTWGPVKKKAEGKKIFLGM